AAKAGIGLSTLMRWLSEPTFAEAYKGARGQIVETTLASLQAASGDAVKTLRGVLTDESARAGEKVSAAKAILEFSLKLREAAQTEERLAALEAVLNQVNQQRKTV
ncbi:MAG: hypothetical protein HOP19_20920, partial [Acidobacteria bacterium]|nr:hypothetical protein [Acidobacteriota bacterium]